MARWDNLSPEVRNKIYALILPLNQTMVPIFVDNTMVFRPMTHDKATNTYMYDGPAIPAAQYAPMTQLNQKIRKETVTWFYCSQTFVFPGMKDIGRFVKILGVLSLSSIRQVAVSASDLRQAGNWYDANDYSCPINILKNLVPLRHCKNLAILNISLEVYNCKNQNKEFLEFEVHGRPILGCGPEINVCISACERCAATHKQKPGQIIQSQHWLWFSAAGSDTWQTVHFIGDTQVQSLTQLLKPYYAAPVDDPAAKQRLAEQLKQKGIELKQTRACGETDNHIHLMPDDLRRSRAYWCHMCEVVIFCSYDCAWNNEVHGDYCVPKPMRKTMTELEDLREQYTEPAQ